MLEKVRVEKSRVAMIRHTENTRVDETSELDTGDVTRRAVDAFKVPDRFGSAGSISTERASCWEFSLVLRLWIDLIQKAATILLGEDLSQSQISKKYSLAINSGTIILL